MYSEMYLLIAADLWYLFCKLGHCKMTHGLWQFVRNKCPRCLPGTPLRKSVFAMQSGCTFFSCVYGTV